MKKTVINLPSEKNLHRAVEKDMQVIIPAKQLSDWKKD